MESIRIGIITGDIDYGNVLSLGIVRLHNNFPVSLRHTDDFQSGDFEIWTKYNDIILIDKSTITEKSKMYFKRQSEKYIFLLEKRPSEKSSSEIWKYGNIRETIREIIYLYEKTTVRKITDIEKNELTIYGFASASGGTGCTSVAMGCAREFKRFYGKNVLYVSFEEIESYGEFMNISNENRGMNEYLYNILSKTQNPKFIESFVNSDEYGNEAVVTHTAFNTLRGLSSDEMIIFFDSIVKSGRYDIIITDFGTYHTGSATSGFELCDKLCLISSERRCTFKDEIYMKYMKHMMGNEYIDKIIRVLNMCKQSDENEQDNDIISNNVYDIKIEYDPGSFAVGDKVSLTIDRGFGKGILQLARMLRKI